MNTDSYELYVHITPSNKMYFGISVNSKRRWHNGLGYNYNKHFCNAIKKYGWTNIKHIIIFDNLSKDMAEVLEQAFIKKFHTQDPNIGYNQADGGYVNSGYRHTEEYKRKSSESRKGKYTKENNSFYGKHHTEETKLKCGMSMRGKHHTEETKKRISAVSKGRQFSAETREKISKALTGIKRSDEYKKNCHDRMIGNVPWNKGMQMSEEHKAKLKANHKGTTGKKWSEETKQKIREAALKREARKRGEL